MRGYQYFCQLIAEIARSRQPSNTLLWCGTLLAFLYCLWLLIQQQAGVQWLPALLVICWSLLVLFIRYCPLPLKPQPLHRPWPDWWRRQFFRLKLHTMALLILALLLGTAFTTLKIISMILRQS